MAPSWIRSIFRRRTRRTQPSPTHQPTTPQPQAPNHAAANDDQTPQTTPESIVEMTVFLQEEHIPYPNRNTQVPASNQRELTIPHRVNAQADREVTEYYTSNSTNSSSTSSVTAAARQQQQPSLRPPTPMPSPRHPFARFARRRRRRRAGAADDGVLGIEIPMPAPGTQHTNTSEQAVELGDSERIDSAHAPGNSLSFGTVRRRRRRRREDRVSEVRVEIGDLFDVEGLPESRNPFARADEGRQIRRSTRQAGGESRAVNCTACAARRGNVDVSSGESSRVMRPLPVLPRGASTGGRLLDGNARSSFDVFAPSGGGGGDGDGDGDGNRGTRPSLSLRLETPNMVTRLLDAHCARRSEVGRLEERE